MTSAALVVAPARLTPGDRSRRALVGLLTGPLYFFGECAVLAAFHWPFYTVYSTSLFLWLPVVLAFVAAPVVAVVAAAHSGAIAVDRRAHPWLWEPLSRQRPFRRAGSEEGIPRSAASKRPPSVGRT